MIKQDLMEHYGPTMTIHDLAEVFHVVPGTIYNKLSKKIFEIELFRSHGRLFAETSQVAEYIENQKRLKQQVERQFRNEGNDFR